MNDLVYNEIVATPGFEMECAVGTTYSLDAEIFMALALAFGRLGEAGAADYENPVRLLEGLRQAAGKIAIFCNRGGMQPPVRRNPLFAMLDKCVFEVADPGKPLANFHPKLWIIKERSIERRNRRQIKLIVLSRNLTKDTSLDVAVALTAPLGEKPDEELRRKHEPLKTLLEILSVYASSDKRKMIRQLAKDMETMGRFELDSRYIDYDFMPLHFGRNLNERIDFRDQLPGQKMMIVSPFIDRSEKIRENGKEKRTPMGWLCDYCPRQEKILVTRMESLTPEIMELYSKENREVWVISPDAEHNEDWPLNLHAKMYFSGVSKQGGNHLWVGSANATESGFYRNSEFLLRLSMRRGKRQFEDFKKEFCDEKKQLCQRVTTLPDNIESTKEDRSIEIKVRTNLLKPNNLSAVVEPAEEGYDLKIRARKIKDIPGIIKIAPIQEPFNNAQLTVENKECSIHISDAVSLSEFYILTVEPQEEGELKPLRMTVKIPTTGIPEDRDDRIFKSIIDTRDKFLCYVEMMITDRPFEANALLNVRTIEKLTSDKGMDLKRSTALYESLLRIAATNPGKLEEIQDLISRVDSRIIPESFLQMAEMFKSSVKKLRR